MSGQTLTETLASKRSALRERIDTIHRRVQYEPWFIKVSTLDRRILLAIGCVPVVVFILIIAGIVAAATSGGDCQNLVVLGADYRGSDSRTTSGLECLPWTTLDRNIHTVTIDRYPDHGLGEHNYCRNPDRSKQAWCYTSRTKNKYDYCDIPDCGSGEPRAKALTGRFRANTDWACQPRVTVVNSIRADGLYLMTEQWANGRGVYARRDNDINTLCISWHGLYRHWWLGPCTHVGKNAGVGWMEEDGRCPYDGSNWRAGGTDRLMVGALVTTNSCMDFETEYNGTLVADSGQNVQRTDTAIACQTLCQQTKTCMAFTWYNRNTNCTLLSKITDKRNNIKYTVSGLPSCKEKVKVGCPSDHVKTESNICIKFLDKTCGQGCSRYAAMEECEKTGGFLADSLEENDIRNILEIAGNSYNHSFWWVGASDMSKRGGKFSWERGDMLMSDMPDLWRNTSTHAEVGMQGDKTLHECVFISHAGGGMRLDHQNCQDTIARPLCQYLSS